MGDNYQISSLNMLATSPGLAITEGAACDPPYLYVTPHNTYIIAKIDTRTFTIVDTLDLSQFDKGLTGMAGSFVANGFLYILPHLSNGSIYQSNVVRVDLSDFTPGGCESLTVLDASNSLSALGGLSDGQFGYLNLTVVNQTGVTRFGLGRGYTAKSVSTVTFTEIDNYPVLLGNLVAVDQTNAYIVATVVTYPGTGHNDRTMDLWLVTIPTARFTASAATFQRLTNASYLGGSVPRAYCAVDDGRNLWLPPTPLSSGPMAGKSIGVIQIPKHEVGNAVVHAPPPSQPDPTSAAAGGTAVYDGYRYGYYASQTAPQICQLDTANPGTVNLIDISANSAGYPMYGLGYDGTWLYAVSFNGGAGLCLRMLPPPKTVAAAACPCCEPGSA